MLKAMLHRLIAAFERRYDYDMSYGHDLLRVRTAAFIRFMPVSWLSTYCDHVPLGAWFAAKLTAALHEDCGPCTQLVIRMAEEAGLAPAMLRAILERDLANLDADTHLGLLFASAVVMHAAEVDGLRAQVIERWGERGLASLALVIAGTRVFPTVKIALGHGHACGLLTVGKDMSVRPVRAAAA
jgi:hypothetical protein